jgi:SAM-dependent methyltransferase
VRYLVGDAQVATFDEPFDVVVSRFGLMFFDDPVAAFANLHRAVTAAGRFVTVCWQGVNRNDWMRVPAAALAQVVPVANLGEPGQPGPFALADRDRLVGIVTDAGWRTVDLEPIDVDVVLGARTLDDTLAFLRGNNLVGSTLEGVDPDRQRAALDAVRDALAPHLTEDGVRLPAAAWLVRAGA